MILCASHLEQLLLPGLGLFGQNHGDQKNSTRIPSRLMVAPCACFPANLVSGHAENARPSSDAELPQDGCVTCNSNISWLMRMSLGGPDWQPAQPRADLQTKGSHGGSSPPCVYRPTSGPGTGEHLQGLVSRLDGLHVGSSTG